MSKLMKSLPMSALMERIIGEKKAKNTIYDIPFEVTQRVLELEAESKGFKINDVVVGLPIGPAAGPHTQIAPNIIASWLSGARVFELKTVQENDRLDIEKPCIDALDEGHNVEWSTELLLEEARAEYIRAYIALHILGAAFANKAPKGNFIFNMSVGYTLDGIKSQKVDAFIEGMRTPENTEIWKTAIKEAKEAVNCSCFADAFGKQAQERAIKALEEIPLKPIHSLTLSTMHGCPPAEIEKIGSYFIEEKHFDSYIKLNPTLLGYDEARSILDKTKWEKIELTRPTFEHDLQFDAALNLISNLREKAKKCGVKFGIKLSNTLANVNNEIKLPGAERYMSGRSLFALTTRLATRLAKAIPEVPAFSYCGGASKHNAFDCLKAGLGPLTVATDILKPLGYMRLEGMAKEAVRAINSGLPEKPDATKLEALSKNALEDTYYFGNAKKGTVKIYKDLPLTDCFDAPCVEACPASQKAPLYIKAITKGDYKEALKIILEDNPLPHITGSICDHKCMKTCSRLDYDKAVDIRGLKYNCATCADIVPEKKPAIVGKGKTAVFGAGPAGLATAHFLSCVGYPVTVFDKAKCAGGVPANVIPDFRIKEEDIKKDIERIKALGAEFVYNFDGKIDFDKLKKDGFSSFVLAFGADKARELPLKGQVPVEKGGLKVIDALKFLENIHNKNLDGNYKEIVIAGGGNTAMDAARAAKKQYPTANVSLLYRRTLAEMPADKDEYYDAIKEGIIFKMLSLPESVIPSEKMPKLSVMQMKLGEKDSSGRSSPVPSGTTFELSCDLLIAAIGETPDSQYFEKLGIECKNGRPVASSILETNIPNIYVAGDARRGPASIIAAVADGREAAHAILDKASVSYTKATYEKAKSDIKNEAERSLCVNSYSETNAFNAKEEAKRCLDCASLCLRCVEVCPNRANLALPIKTKTNFAQEVQVVHIDELCNECGNCGFFCPYNGEPYKGKITLFSSEKDLLASKNIGFAFINNKEQPALAVRKVYGSNELGHPDFEKWQKCTNPIPSIAREIFLNHKYLVKIES